MYTKHKWLSENHYNFKYLKYMPKDCENGNLPLVIMLHGAGERGDDIDVITRHGFMRYIAEGTEYPFICIAPQCPADKYWGCFTESLLAFVDELIETLPVDKNRVYLTGLSMGGTGTWMLAMAAPEKFAAIMPVCGSGIVWNAGCLKDIPIYTYHGVIDPIVPISDSVNMVAAVNKCGGNAKMKIGFGWGHNMWDAAYTDPELLTWLLEQRK